MCQIHTRVDKLCTCPCFYRLVLFGSRISSGAFLSGAFLQAAFYLPRQSIRTVETRRESFESPRKPNKQHVKTWLVTNSTFLAYPATSQHGEVIRINIETTETAGLKDKVYEISFTFRRQNGPFNNVMLSKNLPVCFIF